MSINVTVNGNPLSIRRGRMVLSDLDQIKKNERDRRRRLRLEQVRQQSREISDRLLERAKNIAKEELKKFTTNGAVNLKAIYNGKIMEVQQKYQEDMADIGQAHISATLEPDHEAMIQEKEKRNKLVASKRGKEAMRQVHNVQKDNAQQLHRERLREVRELEDIRSAMVAKLPQNVIPKKDAIIKKIDKGSKQHKPVKKKMKKLNTRKSPGKITKTYLKVVPSDHKTFSPLLKSNSKTVCINTGNDSSIPNKRCVDSSTASPLMSETLTGEKSSEQIAHVHEEGSKKAVSVSNFASVEADRAPRYNPEDYVQQSSDSAGTTNGDSSNLFSDDSSYFSDNGEQSKYIRKSKDVRCQTSSKVQVYDHNKHQRNTYEKPVDVVEKIHTWNEPSATDLAQEIRQSETSEAHLLENCKCNAHKRGEDAAVREKVRRDYQALIQNLSHLASEERKLKASQVAPYQKDVHVQEERRKILRDQHQKKLNRAVKTLINEECLEHPSCSVERQITITPRENNEADEVRVVWDASYPEEHTGTSKSSQNKYRENEVSREEQILDMLKKVERQRQLLLKEFGADLPNDIFNATAKPLFEKEKSIPMQLIPSHDTDVQTPLSPEIRVISTYHDERSKKSQVEKDTSSVEKVEIAIQTATGDKRDVVQDKSVQVELMQGKDNEFNSVTKDTETIPKHYPIEPKITVITPKADSSESTNCTGTNTVINTDKSDLGTTKKKKRTVKKMKQISSKRSQRSSSLQVNKAPSFAKKFPKSLSRSRYSTSQKIEGAVIDTPSKRIKIYVNKSGCSIKVNPPQTTDVAVDASTQNSQAYSTDTREQPASKLHYMQSQSKRTIIKDISDSSTSFASLPPIRPKNLLEVLSNNLSILEMLDSSANESMRRSRRDVSPVSTPETPSPRTMRIPSNVPHPSKISKMLRYASTDTQVNGSSILSSTKSGYSASTDLSDYQQNEHVLDEGVATSSKEPLRSQEFCSCKNPECKLMHAKLDIVHNDALKNCPQILQKYQDLQTVCAERIVSLTNLIEKVRNEQKGMELSGFSAADETSLMQLPPPKPRTNDLQSVRQLVENIEAIHDQLAKTLIESQRIIKNKGDVKEESQQAKETEVITNENTSRNVTQHIDSKTKVSNTKALPRIISEERVNIQIDGLKTRHRPQLVPATSDRDSGLSPKFYDEEMIEQLSKEILEQSKSFGNNVPATKGTNTSVANHTSEKLTDTTDFKDEPSSRTQKNNIAIKKQSNKEVKKIKDFVPLLADIPKISRTIENSVVLNGRSKPPVTLLSGPYRAEIESSGHELSTIIEFDTPDTLNKSQNIRTPTPIKKTAETQITKSTVTRNKNFDPSTSKVSAIVTARKVQESLKISKDTENRTTKIKDEKKKYSVREPNDKRLQSIVIGQRSIRVEESQPVSPTSTDRNKQDKSNRDRITSTSSNSFSGLSGISQIASTPTSDVSKYASSPEEMEMALKKLGLGWAITTVKRTREASALSSSSNSDDRTPMGTAKRIISPSRKQFDSNYGLPDFSDVSSISIKEASKSTEQAVLLKGRTSTPKMQYSNSNSARVNSSNTNVSENYQEPSDALIVPDVSLNKNKS